MPVDLDLNLMFTPEAPAAIEVAARVLTLPLTLNPVMTKLMSWPPLQTLSAPIVTGTEEGSESSCQP